MKLYLISQTENDGYDTYSSAVVAAKDEEEAKEMHPEGHILKVPRDWKEPCGSWASGKRYVKVQCIGIATRGTKRQVICASFHAG